MIILHQLAISLLGCSDPDEVVRRSLDMLHERTKASVVGFLWVTEEGELKPKLVIPEDQGGKVTLSETLTEKVCRQRHAVLDRQQRAEHEGRGAASRTSPTPSARR